MSQSTKETQEQYIARQKRSMLEDALAERDQKLAGFQRRLDAANAEKQALQRKLNISLEHASDMTTEKDVITAECDALRAEMRDRENAIKTREANVRAREASMKSREAVLTAQNNSLKDTISSMTIQLSQNASHSEDVLGSAQQEALQAKLARSTETISALSLENSQHRARISSLDATKAGLEADLAARTAAERAATSRADSLSEEVRRVREELASQQATAAREAATRQEEKERHAKAEGELQARLQALQADNDRLKSAKSTLGGPLSEEKIPLAGGRRLEANGVSHSGPSDGLDGSGFGAARGVDGQAQAAGVAGGSLAGSAVNGEGRGVPQVRKRGRPFKRGGGPTRQTRVSTQVPAAEPLADGASGQAAEGIPSPPAAAPQLAGVAAAGAAEGTSSGGSYWEVAEKRRRGKPAKLTSPAPLPSGTEPGVAEEESKPPRRKPGPKPKGALPEIGPDGQPVKIRKKPGRKPKGGEPAEGVVETKIRKKPGRKVGWKKPKPVPEEEGVGVPVVAGVVKKGRGRWPKPETAEAAPVGEVKKGRGRWPKPEVADTAVAGAGGGEGVPEQPVKIRKKPGRKSKAELLAAATGVAEGGVQEKVRKKPGRKPQGQAPPPPAADGSNPGMAEAPVKIRKKPGRKPGWKAAQVAAAAAAAAAQEAGAAEGGGVPAVEVPVKVKKKPGPKKGWKKAKALSEAAAAGLADLGMDAPEGEAKSPGDTPAQKPRRKPGRKPKIQPAAAVDVATSVGDPEISSADEQEAAGGEKSGSRRSRRGRSSGASADDANAEVGSKRPAGVGEEPPKKRRGRWAAKAETAAPPPEAGTAEAPLEAKKDAQDGQFPQTAGLGTTSAEVASAQAAAPAAAGPSPAPAPVVATAVAGGGAAPSPQRQTLNQAPLPNQGTAPATAAAPAPEVEPKPATAAFGAAEWAEALPKSGGRSRVSLVNWWKGSGSANPTPEAVSQGEKSVSGGPGGTSAAHLPEGGAQERNGATYSSRAPFEEEGATSLFANFMGRVKGPDTASASSHHANALESGKPTTNEGN